ncbi:MAG: hypothetical protein NC133_00820 [Prevotella sp.]|nr:hypothetical protein [Prevotella sp.]
MKKINLLFSALMICLALLVAGGATVPAVQFHAQALAVRTASNSNGQLSGIELFDSVGRYAVSQADLKVGETFQFFGYDWRVVYVNAEQKVATFWMADPYTKTNFNATTRAGNYIFKDGTNIWCNGYRDTIWCNEENINKGDVSLGESDIRKFLTNEASTIIDNSDYEKYANKVVKGYVVGTNEVNDNAKQTIPYLAYSKDSVDQVEELKESTKELTAYYNLGENERLWLPSVDEIKNIWQLPETMLGWTDNTVSNRAWLRTPDYQQPGESQYVMAVCSEETVSGNYFTYKAVKQDAGVRPAIHLNIENIETEYQEHLDATGNGSKGGWFDDDWLKALFIVVCVLGIVGVALVIIAVVIKARKNKAESQQA